MDTATATPTATAMDAIRAISRRKAMPHADVSLNHGGPGKRQVVQVVLAASVLLVAFGLRLVMLGAGSIWYDESVSLYLAGLDLPAMVAHTAGDIHPPLYYGLQHFWTLAAGQTEFSAAFFSLLFGLLLVALTQRVASRLAGPWAGWLAAMLVAISPFNLWYSQEIRMYALGGFLALLSTHFMMRLLDGRPAASGPTRRGDWIGYVLSAAAGIYSLYYFFFLLAFQNLYAGIQLLRPRPLPASASRPNPRPSLLLWLSTQAALLFAYLPWLPVAFRQATQPPVPPWRGFTAPLDALVESWTALSLGQSADPASFWPLLLVFLAVYALGMVALARRTAPAGGAAALLLVGYTLIPLATILEVSAVVPLYHVRYVFTYAAAFYIVLGAGLDRLGRWRGAALAIVLVAFAAGCALSLRAYFTDPAYAADDHRAAVRFLADRWRPGDAILINAGYVYPAVLYYYGGEIAWRGRLHDYAALPGQAGAVLLQTGSVGGSPQLGWGNPSSDFYATTEAEMAADLDRVARIHPRLWVYRCYDTVTDPNEAVRGYLDRNFLKLEDAGFAGSSYIRVQLYQTSLLGASVASVPRSPSGPADFAGLVQLLGYRLEGAPQSGSPLYLALYWQASRPLDTDLKAFVTLRDASGVVAQWDQQPVGPLYPSHLWTPGAIQRDPWRLGLPLGLPPGEYRLSVGLYRATDGQRLNPAPGDGGGGGEFSLGAISVSKEMLPADARGLPVQTRLDANLGDAVDLVGATLSQNTLAPGKVLGVTLIWRARRDLQEDYTVFLQLLDGAGKPWAAEDARPWQGRYPTSRWQAGEVVRDSHTLTLAADAPDGAYRLIAGLYRSSDRQRLPLAGLFRTGDSVELGTVQVAGSPRDFTAPAMQHLLDYRFGEGILLLGFDDEEGESVTLYWQSQTPVKTSYTVFVHVLDASGRLIGQHDAIPAGGMFPTSGWVKGQVVADRHPPLRFSGWRSGAGHTLAIGLYDAVTGQRLPAFDASGKSLGDEVLLPR
jgi:hypothetical protein